MTAATTSWRAIVQGLGIDNPISMYRGGESYWYHSDALGSIHQLSDSTQTIARSYDYSAFGKIISESGSLANPFSYTGREYDSDSGLYYYRARYYDSSIGRFLSVDKGPYQKNLSRYNYAENDPILLIDPLGLKCVEKEYYSGKYERYRHHEIVCYGREIMDVSCTVCPSGKRDCEKCVEYELFEITEYWDTYIEDDGQPPPCPPDEIGDWVKRRSDKHEELRGGDSFHRDCHCV